MPKAVTITPTFSSPLAQTFARYLRSGSADDAAARELARALEEAGYALEAAAMAGVMAQQSGVTLGAGPFEGAVLSLDPEPPPKPEVGDLWFDRLEVVAMVRVENTEAPGEEMASWISLSPVRTWQFEGFRSVVRLGRSLNVFPNPEDYMAHPVSTDPHGLVGDIYHDEALAYAHWFGKGLAGNCDWQDVRDTFGADVLDRLLPPDRLAWDEAEYARSEWARLAWKQISLDKWPVDEHEDWLQRRNVGLPDRVIFNEWERLPEIGLSTSLEAAFLPRFQELPGTLFFDLDNSAASPEGHGPGKPNPA